MPRQSRCQLGHRGWGITGNTLRITLHVRVVYHASGLLASSDFGYAIQCLVDKQLEAREFFGNRRKQFQ